MELRLRWMKKPNSFWNASTPPITPHPHPVMLAFSPGQGETNKQTNKQTTLGFYNPKKKDKSEAFLCSWCRQPGTAAALVDTAKSNLKGSQNQTFEKWERIAMVTKYFSVKWPGRSLTARTFRLRNPQSFLNRGLSQAGERGSRHSSDLCVNE